MKPKVSFKPMRNKAIRVCTVRFSTIRVCTVRFS